MFKKTIIGGILMESLYQLFIAAKNGETSAVAKIIQRFDPLIRKVSRKNGVFDEDCYQECVTALITSIEKFEIRN